MILTTEEVTTATLKAILATDKMNIDTLKVILANTKVILATKNWYQPLIMLSKPP